MENILFSHPSLDFAECPHTRWALPWVLVDNFWLQIIWKSCTPLSPYPGLKSFAIAVKFGVAKSQSDFDLGEELAN